MKVSIVIPTFNGKDLLQENLPSLREPLKIYPYDSEVLIVDNGSLDDTEKFLTQEYPDIRVLKNRNNEGFGPAVNRGVREAKHNIVITLNNDIKVEKDFIAPLTRHFHDPSVFAVVSKSLVNVGGRILNESVTVPVFDDGFFLSHQPLVHDPGLKIEETCTNLHASGGFAAFDKKKFLTLGGFDEIYHPFYYEDIDLSYQAWKRGWQVLYEPKSIVYHRSHGTTRKVATDTFIHRIEQRNKFLFSWKNLSDPQFLFNHIRRLVKMLFFAVLPGKKGERYLLLCFLMALKRLPKVLHFRVKNSKYTRLSDKRIFYIAANKETPEVKFERLLDKDGFDAKKGIKILLIDPPAYQKGLNVGLAYIAGSLKKNNFHNIDVLDLNNVFSEVPFERLIQLLKKKDYDLIGYSIKTPTYNAAVELSMLTKKHFPKAVHIAGGPHITLNYNEFIKENEQFDYVLAGEGEYSFIDFCKMLDSGKKYQINGIIGRKDNEDNLTTNFVKDLDELPFPDLDVFKGFDFTNFEYPIVTSRGCPYSCTYCSVGLISGKKIRFRDVEKVIDELKWAKEKLNIKRFNIVDDNFTQDIKRAKHFCDRLIKENLGLEWLCGNGIRADKIDEELAEKMKKAQCQLVCVGVENADPIVFDTIKKGESIEDIKRGTSILKDAGIEVVGFFIIGLPGDSRKSSEMALEFIKKSRLDSARFGILLPYPKTKAYDLLVEKGTFLKDYKEGIHFSDNLTPVFETKEFPASEMVETYERLYTKLRYFVFLMPEDITDRERVKRTVRFIWKYDRTSFITTPIQNFKGFFRGFK